MNKILRIMSALIGVIIGIVIAATSKETKFVSKNIPYQDNVFGEIGYYVLIAIIFGIIFYFLFPLFIRGTKKLMKRLENYVQNISIADILIVTISGIIGLLVTSLFGSLMRTIPIPILSFFVTIVAYIFIPLTFITIAIIKKNDILSLNEIFKKRSNTVREKKSFGRKSSRENSYIKVLDTSVIIDGRIFDLTKTGFIEGKLIIPNFILDELRHISDSEDGLKRNRGRRGLDILNKIQKELDIEVEILDKDYKDLAEVDAKLLRLTKELNGKVLTNDYNLNKVAEVQGVFVLNINELANAIKPVVLPGEKMIVQVIKEGKEHNQGIAYLDDGTMIVVEGARKKVGEDLDVEVTSVIQTAAGRMIFANMK